MSINFIHIEMLWCLLGLPLIAFIILYFERLRKTRTSSLGAKCVERNKLYLLLVPMLVATLLIIALARPYTGSEDIKISKNGSDIVLVVDVSRSMLATDISPSRLEFVKRKLEDFTRLLASKADGDKVGIVLFAGESYLYCPLTQDYGVLEYFIKSISTDLITSQGSALSDAIETAVKSLQEVKSVDGRVIVISDGEDEALNSNAAIDLAINNSIAIDALGVGTLEGSPIDQGQGVFVKDSQGKIVISKLNEVNLQTLSAKTGGTYQKAVFSEADFNAVLASRKAKILPATLTDVHRSSITVYKEIGPYLVLTALLTLAFASFTKFKEYIFIITLTVTCCARTVVAQDETTSDRSTPSLHAGYQAYQQNEFEKASNIFKDHLALDPENLDIMQAYGSSLYKSSRYKEAKDIFEKLISKKPTPNQKFETLYNLGNTNFNLEDYQSAINNYEQALTIKADDANTKNNLNIARRKLIEKQRQPTPTPTPTATANKEQSPQTSPSASPHETGSPSPSASQIPSESADQGQSDQQATPKAQPNDSDENNSPNLESSNQDSAPRKDNPENSDSSNQDQKNDEEEKEKEQQDSELHSQASKQAKNMDEKALRENEAKAWLESLSDSPILLRRKVGKTINKNGQTW